MIQNLDWAILDALRRAFVCPPLDVLMPVVTHLGDGGALWILCAVALLISRKYRRSGAMLLCGLAAGALIGNLLLKNLIARPRPCWLQPDVPLLIAVPKDFSFPSGHTLASVIAATTLARTHRKFGWIAIPTAALIAFSRLYLFVHFPSDVLASVLLGLAVERIVRLVFDRKREKSGA